MQSTLLPTSSPSKDPIENVEPPLHSPSPPTNSDDPIARRNHRLPDESDCKPRNSLKRPPQRDTDTAQALHHSAHHTKRRRVGAHSELAIPPAPSKKQLLRQTIRSVQSSPAVPQQSSLSTTEAAAAMLDRPEDTGGTRTIKLARAPLSSSRRPASRPISRGNSDNSTSLSRGPSGSQRVADSQKEESINILDTVGIAEVLDQDERPTFIIDVGDSTNFQPGELLVIFANSSIKARPNLLDYVVGRIEEVPLALATPASFPEFKTWALSFVKNAQALSVTLPSFTYAGMIWTCSTLRKRFRLIAGRPAHSASTTILAGQQYMGLGSISPGSQASSQGTVGQGYFESMDTASERSKGPNKSSSSSSGRRSVITEKSRGKESSGRELDELRRTPRLGQDPDNITHEETEAILLARSAGNVDSFGLTALPETGFFDWTRLPMSSALPRHIQFARSIDWASTSIGPMETWSSDLRGMCNLIMASPHPAAMYWGEDHVAIYNEAYIMLAGEKHPELMGKPYAEAWKEIWFAIEDVFDDAKNNAQATMKDDDRLFIYRQGFLEETYFSWSIIPLIGSDGSVVGLYNPAFEKTRRKIAERRMLTLREIGEQTASAREITQFWPLLMKGLEYNEYDVPLALIYAVADENDSDASSMHSSSLLTSKHCVLQAAFGVPSGHPAAPAEIELGTSMEGFAPAFRDAIRADRPMLLQEEDGSLPEGFLAGVEQRGFGDACRSVVVCPIHPTTGESTLGFLVIGNNPRRPYDEDYSLFIQLLGRQLATSIASVILYEEEIRRAEKAAKLAAQDRIELSNQLAIRTQEAVESEYKFTRMAELTPVGMFIADSAGKITYCNDTWFEISRCYRHGKIEDEWLSYIHDADRESFETAWQTLIVNRAAFTIEFRFKHPWRDRNGNSGDTWVLCSAYPERGEDGYVKSIFGSITDISSQKFAEDLQKRRMEEAVEMKRQKENFIDITSHEMRNPLSAILQCAEEISTTLSESLSADADSMIPEVLEIVESNIDAAQTIMLCAQHQKRIVDDILTLSKLDSAMLLVTPVDVKPVAVVQRALKMFENELQTADIKLEINLDASLEDLKIQWVKLDPSRLLQVLINLTTNAIKFTQAESKRVIVVHVGASEARPMATEESEVEYVTPDHQRFSDPDVTDEWGTGDPLYLRFAVQDTGRGLTEAERKLMFLRFSQASPRTHVQYGGSGLGLFISRQLVELQGGQIGVASESGKGSTFAFYVKARRSTAPADGVDHSDNISTRKGSNSKSLSRVSSTAGDSAQPVATAVANLQKSLPPHSLSASKTPGRSSATRNTTATGQTASSPLKILIVEDNLVNQKVLAKQLQKAGCIVTVANHGKEGIDILRKTIHYTGDPDAKLKGLDLDIILMDLEMPVMDGITCVTEIRRMQKDGELRTHIPVIAVTANARDEQIETALESGMDDVVSKPFRIPELIPKVRKLLDRFANEEESVESGGLNARKS